MWKSQGPKQAKTILIKQNKVGEITMPKVKSYYKATVFNFYYKVFSIQGLL